MAKVEETVQDIEKKISLAVNKEYLEAKDLFTKIVAFFKALQIRVAVAKIQEIEKEAINAGVIIAKEVKVNIKTIEDVVKKFEGKLLSFEKITMADAILIKQDWMKAINKLKALIAKK